MWPSVFHLFRPLQKHTGKQTICNRSRRAAGYHVLARHLTPTSSTSVPGWDRSLHVIGYYVEYGVYHLLHVCHAYMELGVQLSDSACNTCSHIMFSIVRAYTASVQYSWSTDKHSIIAVQITSPSLRSFPCRPDTSCLLSLCPENLKYEFAS
jgi:hypothetical protein